MGVPFVDLKAQYHSIKAEVDAALIATMESCAFTLGPEVAQLEKDFAVYAGTLCGGRQQRHNALILRFSQRISPGDEVTVPFTFIASASIHYTGAKPVISTSVLSPVPALSRGDHAAHQGHRPGPPLGQMADMDPIMASPEVQPSCSKTPRPTALNTTAARRSIGDARASRSTRARTCRPGKGGITTPAQAQPQAPHAPRLGPGKYHHEIIGYNMRLEGIRARCSA
jgi:hypothetical protein